MDAPDLRDGDPFPMEYLEPLQSLWKDPSLEAAISRGNEAALPEKWVPSLYCIINLLITSSLT